MTRINHEEGDAETADVANLGEAVGTLSLSPAASEPATIDPSDESFSRGSETSSGPTIRLFIGDLHRSTTEASLRKYFEQYGSVERATVKHPNARPWQRHEPQNHTAQRSFGFITVFSDELAKKLTSMTHIIDGHHVGTPELAKPARNDREKARRGEGAEGALNANAIHASAGWALGPNSTWEPTATRKIFVGGLSHQMKDQSLMSYFSQFGTVADVVVMTEGSSRRPRGFGFVTFEDPKVVMAVTRTRYHPIEGRLVEVKPAVPREIMSLTQGQNPAVVGAGDNDFATPTGDAMACGLVVPDSTPGSPTMAIPGQEWYSNGYGYGYQQNYAAPNQMMIGGGMPDMTMTTGVPVYNGYAPGFAPQMMVPMGMMMPMANVMGTAMPPVMSPAMPPSMVPNPVAKKMNQMAAPPLMMPSPHNMMHGGTAAAASYAGPPPMPGAVPVDATATLKAPEAQTASATADSSA